LKKFIALILFITIEVAAQSTSTQGNWGRSPSNKTWEEETMEARQLQFLSLYSPNFSPANFDYSHAFSRDIEGSNANFESDSFRFRVDAPIATTLAGDSYFMAGGTYALRSLQFGSELPRAVNDRELVLHQLEARPGVAFFPSDDMLIWAQARAGFFGTLEDGFSEDNFQLMADSSLAYLLHDNLMAVAGISISEDIDQARALPTIGFRYRTLSGDFLWKVNLPREALVFYQAAPRMRIFGGFMLEGNSYFYDGGDDGGFDIQVRDQKLGGGLLFNVGKKALLTLEGGAMLGGDALVFKDRRNDLNGDVDTVPYVGLRVGSRF
jgi:hypothetical protein